MVATAVTTASLAPSHTVRTHPAPSIEADDIQGLVVRGYGTLPYASYHVLGVRDPAAARRWLAWLARRVARGEPASRSEAVQVAFTYEGLRLLGLPESALAGFSREFISGMTEPQRSRFLGDEADSAPVLWKWGGPANGEVHAVLMLFALSGDSLRRQQAAHERHWADGGCAELTRIATGELTRTEHFGFADGISQPAIDGYHASDSELHCIKPGEFVLGYENEYEQYTGRPLVGAADDPHQLLPFDLEGTGQRDFGRNGTYAVFRQLRQDVPLFHAVLQELSRKPDGSPDPDAKDWLAAKMVGRWPSGASLVDAPQHDAPHQAGANEFRYHADDPDGLKCPIGSHVRRTNPRDSLAPGPGSNRSLAVNKRHRLLRRGRAYGTRLEDGGTEADDRGIMFIALNANIQRQFEFIQHTWINSPSFAGLYNDRDPIVGPGQNSDFTIARDPVRRKCSALPRFVEVQGGAYLFMPGIRALQYLASR